MPAPSLRAHCNEPGRCPWVVSVGGAARGARSPEQPAVVTAASGCRGYDGLVCVDEVGPPGPGSVAWFAVTIRLAGVLESRSFAGISCPRGPVFRWYGS